MEQSLSLAADTHLARQETFSVLWNLKVTNHVSPPLNTQKFI